LRSFFKLTSFASSGGSYINWSNRFSISGLAGPAAPAAVLAAVTALAGATAGPGPINKLGSGGAPGGDGLFDIPFNLQTGLTRYAPMQPIPPTKITAKVFKPLFPTSAYTIAKTFLPNPTVQKTVTEQQTFSASSIENPVSPLASCRTWHILTLVPGRSGINAHRHGQIPETLAGRVM
jgi:hypothetical protein